MFVATSLAVLWLIIVAIDDRAGELMVSAFRSGVSTNSGLAAQMSGNVSHVTRSVWELSFIYGPLMTFAAVALILVAVMTRTTR